MAIKVLYFSPTTTTKKIVKSIASGIGNISEEYDVTSLNSHYKTLSYSREDLVIVGVPVYGGRVPKLIVPFLSKLESNGAKAVAVVTYGVRAYEDALIELRDILVEDKFNVVAGATFVCEHSIAPKVGQGKPNQKDYEQAASFGAEVKSKIRKGGVIENIEVNGNRPYIEKAAPKEPVYTAPITSNACNNCGFCAEICPTGAISMKDYSSVDEKKCIRCHGCVRRCPVSAKVFTHESVLNTIKWLEASCLDVEKDNEFFL